MKLFILTIQDPEQQKVIESFAVEQSNIFNILETISENQVVILKRIVLK